LPASPCTLQTQVKLRAEANILSRAIDKLKAEKAADAARVAALQQELSGLQQQLTGAGSVADKLRAELMERDGVISDNYVTMQGLRRRVQELETHKFVLTYKVSTGMAPLGCQAEVAIRKGPRLTCFVSLSRLSEVRSYNTVWNRGATQACAHASALPCM
jgi:hypothetical protein